MDPARIDDPSENVLRVNYRDPAQWLGTLLLLVIVGSPFLLGASFALDVRTIVWLIGLVLAVVSGAVIELRSARGLTLDADGITWHRVELFIPWSRVTEVDVDTNVKGKGKPYLVVRTTEPAEALRGQRGIAKFIIKGTTRLYGGPIAVKAHFLTVPAESVIAAAADRMQQDTRPDDHARQAERVRARKVADFWAYAGFAGYVAWLAALVLPTLI
ncbi:hypothetical protein [Spirillospora sp. NPDC048819]|uniref:hypothetical protein n=1 Tax=Spirillospora sp. NPDC048819 TaxID=3155268 RepID=UPI0034089826